MPLLSLCVQDVVILRGRRYHVRPNISLTPSSLGQAAHLNALPAFCTDKKVCFPDSTSMGSFQREATSKRLAACCAGIPGAAVPAARN